MVKPRMFLKKSGSWSLITVQVALAIGLATMPASATAHGASYRELFAVNDPLTAGEWSLNQINAKPAWLAAPSYGSPVTVAILDAGIAIDHVDLAGQLWDNPDDPANGLDDDSNGVVDDTHGIAYVGGGTSADLTDSDGHGSHVAGIIGAAANNGIGIAGLSPAARLMVVKVISPTGTATESDVLMGMKYAIDHGARIINISMGVNSSAFSDGMQSMLDYAEAMDVLVVAAAGNDGTDNDAQPVYPASATNAAVISVASTEMLGGRATFSNWGHTSVDLAAPGAGVTSTMRSGGYGELSGTSMAAPHVSGVAAFLMSQRPSLTALQVRKAILDSVQVRPAWTGLTVTGGILDMSAALTYALSMPDAAPVNIVAPTFDGEVHRVGSDWTCDTGKWNAATTSFEFKWTQSSTVVSTSRTFNPGPSFDGKQVECTVTGVNSSGDRAVALKASGWVAPALPTLTSLTITPLAQVGKVVQCKPTGTGNQFIATWMIDGVPIDYTLNYRVPDSAAGKVLGCKTKMVNRISESSSSMTVYQTVPWPRPSAVIAPKVIGGKAGKPLKCSVRWKFQTASSLAWSRDKRLLPGKTAATLKTTRRDKGHRFSCIARAIGNGGSTSLASKQLKLK